MQGKERNEKKMKTTKGQNNTATTIKIIISILLITFGILSLIFFTSTTYALYHLCDSFNMLHCRSFTIASIKWDIGHSTP